MDQHAITAMLLVGLMVMPTIAAVSFDGIAGEATAQSLGDHGLTADIRAKVAAVRGFVENLGQFGDDGVAFYTDAPGLDVALLDDGILLDLRTGSSTQGHPGGPGPIAPKVSRLGDTAPPIHERSGCVVRLSFAGAEPVRPVGRGMIPGAYNYFIGNDPSMWRTGARAYSEVVYEGLYPGIDLVYRASSLGIKYEFLVAPWADPSSILVHAEGQDSLGVQDGTTLAIETGAGRLVDDGLLAYNGDDPSSTVDCSFELTSPVSYVFQIGSRDPSRPLVIDPLLYATYLGGTSSDDVDGIMTSGADGSVLACGMTYSAQFPTTPGAYQTALDGWGDVFVTKLSADGSTLVYSTLIGGSEYEYASGIDVSAGGAAYLVGTTTSDDFPVSPGAVQPTLSVGYNSTDGFACKLNSTGALLLYSTYVGGSGTDSVESVDADEKGCAYFVGETTSNDFPVTPGAFQNASRGYRDGFVCKLNANGTRYVYSTYLSGNEDTEPRGVVVDSSGCAYVTGGTYSDDFPVTQGAYSTQLNGRGDAFVSKLNGNGTDLVWSTYLGGSDFQDATGIVLGDGGMPIVTGYTYSSDFPTTAGAYQTKIDGNSQDAFVTILAADATKLNASTFLGGRDSDDALSVWVDPFGGVLVCGATSSDDFPTTEDAEQTDLDGYGDAFVSSLSSDLAVLIYSTYIGGSEYEYATGVVHNGNHTVYVGGNTYSDDFPVTANAYQPSYADGGDGFLYEFVLDSMPPTAEAGDDVTIDQHQTVELDGSRSSDNMGVVDWTWTFHYNGSDVVLYGSITTFQFDEAGRYEVTLTVRDIGHLRGTDRLNVTVRDITRPIADAGIDRFIDQHQGVALDGTKSSDNVGIVNYTWTFVYRGHTVTLEGSGPSFMFDDAGAYVMKLNVSDAVGNWATDSLTVVVKDITAPTANAGADTVVEQHTAVVLDGSASQDNVGIVNYTWSFVCGGLPVTLYGPNVTYTFDLAGKYIVTLTVSDELGNVASDTMAVDVLDSVPPTAEAGPDATVLQDQTYRFDGRGSKDNVAVGSWTWRFDYLGVPITLEGSEPQFVFELAGTFLVTLTVADNAGSTAEDTMTVTVKDTETPVARAGVDIQIDQHGSASFDASQSADNLGIVSWTWTLDYRGDRVELQGRTASFLFDDAGTYEVVLTATDAAGNHAADSLTVTVRDTTPPVADAGPDATIDQNAALTLDGSRSTDNVGVISWTWTFTYDGTPVELLGRSQNYTFARPGTYNVTLKVGDARRLYDTTTITIRVRDTVDPKVVAPSHLTATPGDRVTLDGSASTDNIGVVRWEWRFHDGGKDVKLNGSTVSYAFKDKGDHVVTLTTFDAEGNAAAETFTVTIEGGSSLLYVAVLAIVVLHVAIAVVRLRRRKPKAA
jgi:PKD repeat protein